MPNFPSEEIKSRLDISDVLSEYIKLQKGGANYRALCPFHNEKTPSFFVSPARQIWHCFGCGLGGDIFSFVMKMEGVEFVDALRLLAKKAGVELKSQDPKLSSERSLILEICAEATRFFQNNLADKSGEEALEYLKKRGFSKEAVKEFRVGWAPDEWSALYNFLSLKGYKADMIEKAGLVLASDKSGRRKYFDRFRGRIMFPLADQNGAIVGFTGRYLKERPNEGKYVNSPQTPVFNKSAYLFGLDKSKMEIRKSDLAVVVEGQADLMMAWSDGVKNIVAVSGTAFTEQQLNLLGRYTRNLCLIFDSDSAGDTATQRSIALAHALGFSVKVARISDGKDPADFVQAHPGQFAGEIEKAISIMDYYFKYAVEKYDSKNVDGKKQIGAFLLPQIKKIKNKIEMHHWLEKLAGLLGTKIEYLEEEMKQMFLPDEETISTRDQSPAGSVETKTILDSLLEHLMTLILSLKSQPSIEKTVKDIEKSRFYDIMARERKTPAERVFDIFIKDCKIGKSPDSFLSKLDEKEQGIARKVLLDAELASYDDTEKEISFCLSRIEKEIIADQLKTLESRLRQAEAGKDAKLAEELLREVHSLSAKRPH